MGDDKKGEFYEEELSPIEENRYLIERIIWNRKSPKGTPEFLGKWKVRPTKLNSCVKDEDCDYSQKSK